MLYSVREGVLLADLLVGRLTGLFEAVDQVREGLDLLEDLLGLGISIWLLPLGLEDVR